LTLDSRAAPIIPAFALGRAQEFLYLLVDLRRQGKLPRLQVFVDSPMATKSTEITWKHTEFLDDKTRALLLLRKEHPEWLDLHFTQSVEKSIALNRIKAGAIIIPASGMCDAVASSTIFAATWGEANAPS